MLLSNTSIRSILIWTISLFGLLNLIIALVTGSVYRDLTLDNQQQSLEKLIAITSADLLAESSELSSELGMSLQHDTSLRKALHQHDVDELRHLLENQFHQFFVTAQLIEIHQLTIYDTQLAPIAHYSHDVTDNLSCPSLISYARNRQGPDRLKMLDRLCIQNGITYHSILTPVGGLRIMGYIEITTAPEHFIKKMEQALGNPITISYPNEKIAYQSSSWPEESTQKDILTVDYHLPNSEGETAMHIAMVNHIHSLREKLDATRNIIIFGASITTLIAIFIALLALRSTTLRPLTNLNNQIHLMRKDPIYLRKKVDVCGTEETRELADSFNQMTTELNQLYESLQDMAYRDKLTQLPNRNFFHAKLDTLTSAETALASFTLLLIDLDRFKSVNDSLGHHIGDKLLSAAATRFKEQLRTSDTVINPKIKHIFSTHEDCVSRIGGDEFAVILPGISDRKTAEKVARKLLETTREVFSIDQFPLSIGMSIGISFFPEDGADKHTLMRHADIAMYHAKSTKSGFACYEPLLEKQSQDNLAYEKEISQALENRQFTLFYQPKLNTQRKAIGCEALIRWFHPEMGMIPPDQFIPVAEKTGQIKALTDWIFAEAIEQCRNWQNAYPGVGVSVNISAVSLQDPDLVDSLQSVLARHPINPELITLELTETAIMTDPENALLKLNQLSDLGFLLSIDDFGTGYSSLSYMKKLPVDEIKIDRSFVMDMLDDPNDAAIVQSIIALSHSMSLTVIAEGVETEPAFGELARLQCDYVQGYLFSKPLPVSEFIAWLAAHGNLAKSA